MHSGCSAHPHRWRSLVLQYSRTERRYWLAEEERSRTNSFHALRKQSVPHDVHKPALTRAQHVAAVTQQRRFIMPHAGAASSSSCKHSQQHRYNVSCTVPAHTNFTLTADDGKQLWAQLDSWRRRPRVPFEDPTHIKNANTKLAENRSVTVKGHHLCVASHGERRHVFPVDVTGQFAESFERVKGWSRQQAGRAGEASALRVFLVTVVRDPVQRLFSYLHFRAHKRYNAALQNHSLTDDTHGLTNFTVSTGVTAQAAYRDLLPQTESELCGTLERDNTISTQYAYLQPFLTPPDQGHQRDYRTRGGYTKNTPRDPALSPCDLLRLKFAPHNQTDAQWVRS
jgi:hypothetical protein